MRQAPSRGEGSYERGQVLIVDGDLHSGRVLHELLSREGYSVECVALGSEALQIISSSEPNLVLLDTHLGDADSFELRDRIRGSQRALDIPVIFIAALDDAEARLKGLERGDDLISKPFDTREVLARVERQVTVSKVRMALRESEAKFRSVMESAIDAIISGDAEGSIRSWNSAATALFGFKEEEVIGQPIELIIPDRFRDRHREGIRRVSGGGPSHVIGKTVELAALRKDGTEFPVELSLATWFLDENRYYTGIIRDISERKQAEQKFRSVTESAIDAIISADHNGVIISWNRAATRILGHQEEEAVGRRLELIIPERFHEAHREGMRRVTAGGPSHVIGRTVELFAVAKGGVEVPIELSLSTWAVRGERYYTGIIRDIRERKQAETALRESERALRAKTLELRDKNRVLESTLKQLHETQNQLIMQEKMASLGKLSAGMAHELNNPAAAAQRGAAQLQHTFLELQEAQKLLAGQELDETQLEHLADLDARARERAAQASTLDALTRSDQESALEEWLDSAGIDTPWELAPSLVSLGFEPADLEELARQFPPSQLASVLRWLTRIYAINALIVEIGLGTRRITEIVKALKTYTYMDRAPIQSVDLREDLENTLIIFQNRLKMGITVRREYADHLPRIEAYAGELNQVWTNLIDNALDAMDGGGVLTLRAYRDGPWVVVEVEDDGPGIPDDVQPHIFDPFFTTKSPGRGTGLGLNISRSLVVQKHGGLISVSSEPGCTRFIVRLPMQHEPSG